MTGREDRAATWPRVIVVTGTDTGVGKTVATAALAAVLGLRSGRSVAVDKPAQTGAAEGEEPDVEVVSRLGGVQAATEGVRLGPAMAPGPAARRSGGTLPALADHVERIIGLARRHDHVLVEGSGGLLVELTDDAATLADLGSALAAALPGTEGVGLVVVCRAGLGTLNHTALTLEAARRRRLPLLGLVVGSWPKHPDDVDADNRERLAGFGVPLLAAVPAGAGGWGAARFRAEAPGWFATESTGPEQVPAG